MSNIFQYPLNLILSKLFHKYYFFVYKKRPWINKKAFERLKEILNYESIIAEFGSGKSTLFFASICRRVYSIETSMEWYNMLKNKLGARSNVYLAIYAETDHNDGRSYSMFLEGLCNEDLDLLFIDGKYRNYCIENQWKRIKVGGYLVIDDYHRYFKFQSKYGTILSRETVHEDYENCEKILKDNFSVSVFESGGFSTAFCQKLTK